MILFRLKPKYRTEQLRYWGGVKGMNSGKNLHIPIGILYALIKEPSFGRGCYEGFVRALGDAKIPVDFAAAKLYFELLPCWLVADFRDARRVNRHPFHSLPLTRQRLRPTLQERTLAS